VAEEVTGSPCRSHRSVPRHPARSTAPPPALTLPTQLPTPVGSHAMRGRRGRRRQVGSDPCRRRRGGGSGIHTLVHGSAHPQHAMAACAPTCPVTRHGIKPGLFDQREKAPAAEECNETKPVAPPFPHPMRVELTRTRCTWPNRPVGDLGRRGSSDPLIRRDQTGPSPRHRPAPTVQAPARLDPRHMRHLSTPAPETTRAARSSLVVSSPEDSGGHSGTRRPLLIYEHSNVLITTTSRP
jgi:hypothetical protein